MAARVLLFKGVTEIQPARGRRAGESPLSRKLRRLRQMRPLFVTAVECVVDAELKRLKAENG